ncbi:MAG: alginate lyase family protein, partial [Luteolibacter sp.]
MSQTQSSSQAGRLLATISAATLLIAGRSTAHPLSFSSTVSYSPSQPSGGAASISNWTGATFDAANIGGSGVNADGGSDNGAANDASTYVANNQPRQGQVITTGSNPNGYDVASITVRMAGYTNNTATGNNRSGWNMNFTNGPIQIEIGKVTGTDCTTMSRQLFTAGSVGNPGSGQTATGAGTYITFNLPFSTHLEPNTTYGFDFWIGNGSSNYFEWLGTTTDAYAGGTAYTRAWWGGPITPLAGERVFMVNMTASAGAPVAFTHPGTLHTPADIDRMKTKVAANAQPWKADYDILTNSPWAQTWWPAYDVDYINRGGSAANNYTRSQQDAQAIYELALRWQITGDTAYADHAVQIANVWSGLLGVTGDSNKSLGTGICGYLFAIGGDLLSTYPGWPVAEKQAYKDMMMRVFYPENLDFLWRHHDTPFTKGGNTHYRLNWDTANIASMAAIGILCDNRAVYEQAVDFFKYGPSNGRIERAAWYVHPDGMGQTEEIGRDQGHNLGGWQAMALLCQTAWNQGDDLYGYDNNRVLRAFEMNAKYNLGNDVPWVFHRNCDLDYTETISGAERGNFVPMYEQIYNHYVNVKGIAAPYSKTVAEMMRPEPRPDVAIHPSQVDWLGLGSLTYTRDPIAAGVAPSGLFSNWSKNAVTLSWWGSAYATSYDIKRATVSGGPYTTVGSVGTMNTTFTDSNVANGTTYYYIVTAATPTGNLDSAPLTVSQSLVTQYTFENTFNDVVGTRHATAMGGSTGAAGFATGKNGQAASFDGVDDYVKLPVGSGNYQDITLSAWVYWNGGGNW